MKLNISPSKVFQGSVRCLHLVFKSLQRWGGVTVQWWWPEGRMFASGQRHESDIYKPLVLLGPEVLAHSGWFGFPDHIYTDLSLGPILHT